MMAFLEGMEIPEPVKNLAAHLKRPWIAFAAFFVLGCIVFLPLDRLQGMALNMAQKAGVQVNMGPMSISRGIFPEGGLLGITASAFRYEIGFGKTLDCDEVKISPQIWRLLTLRAQLAVMCKKKGAGSALITVRSGFPFKMSDPVVSVSLKDVDLGAFGEPLGISGLKGFAKGTIEASDMNAMNRTGLPGQFEASLKFAKFQTPAFSDPSMGFSMPSIPAQTASIEMSAENGTVDLKRLQIGSEKNTQVFGQFSGKFKMTPVMGAMFPVGDLAGKIRFDKELEDTINAGVSLNGLFGTVKASGFREFKRKKLTAPQSVLFPPEE